MVMRLVFCAKSKCEYHNKCLLIFDFSSKLNKSELKWLSFINHTNLIYFRFKAYYTIICVNLFTMLKNVSCHLVTFIVWTYFICHQSILLKCLRMINKVCRLTTSLTCHCLSLKTEVGTTIVPKCINVCIECYLRLHCFPSYVRMVNSIKPFGDWNKT